MRALPRHRSHGPRDYSAQRAQADLLAHKPTEYLAGYLVGLVLLIAALTLLINLLAPEQPQRHAHDDTTITDSIGALPKHAQGIARSDTSSPATLAALSPGVYR
jgi:hypothetical protein